MTTAPECSHIDEIRVTETSTNVCEDCILSGYTWVHLRMCLTCGHVSCCDSSPRRHALQHFQRTRHPLIRSAEPGEMWTWCYVDRIPAGELEA
jgi:uncharacterized UBP type Zn finger protein